VRIFKTLLNLQLLGKGTVRPNFPSPANQSQTQTTLNLTQIEQRSNATNLDLTFRISEFNAH